MLAGNLCSIFGSAFICIAMSLWKPQNYDWKTTREIPTIDEDASASALPTTGEDSQEAMDKAFKWMVWVGWIFSFILCVAWPLLALPAKIFSKNYFTFWVILAIAWGFIAATVGTFLPLWESREILITVLVSMLTCAQPKDTSSPLEQQVFPAPSYGEEQREPGQALSMHSAGWTPSCCRDPQMYVHDSQPIPPPRPVPAAQATSRWPRRRPRPSERIAPPHQPAKLRTSPGKRRLQSRAEPLAAPRRGGPPSFPFLLLQGRRAAAPLRAGGRRC